MRTMQKWFLSFSTSNDERRRKNMQPTRKNRGSLFVTHEESSVRHRTAYIRWFGRCMRKQTKKFVSLMQLIISHYLNDSIDGIFFLANFPVPWNYLGSISVGAVRVHSLAWIMISFVNGEPNISSGKKFAVGVFFLRFPSLSYGDTP